MEKKKSLQLKVDTMESSTSFPDGLIELGLDRNDDDGDVAVAGEELLVSPDEAVAGVIVVAAGGFGIGCSSFMMDGLGGGQW